MSLSDTERSAAPLKDQDANSLFDILVSAEETRALLDQSDDEYKIKIRRYLIELLSDLQKRLVTVSISGCQLLEKDEREKIHSCLKNEVLNVSSRHLADALADLRKIFLPILYTLGGFELSEAPLEPSSDIQYFSEPVDYPKPMAIRHVCRAEHKDIPCLMNLEMSKKTDQWCVDDYVHAFSCSDMISTIVEADIPVSEDRISQRALEIAEEDDRKRMTKDDHWLQAERELRYPRIGALVYKMEDEHIWISNLVVHPAVRRKRIAEQCIERLKNKLNLVGRNAIRLEIRESDKVAREFFERQKFTVAEVLPSHYRDTHEDAYIMQYQSLELL